MDGRSRQNPAYRLAKGEAPLRRGLFYAAALLAAVALSACGGENEAHDPRAPLPAPDVTLTDVDRERWAPGGAAQEAIPALLYRGVGREEIARQLTLLDHAGYDTIGLDEFVRFVEGKEVELPSRPLLLTFDGARLSTWVNTDAILRELGLEATLFVDVGRVEARDRAYLTWSELNRMQASGRWDAQLQAGTGGHLIRYGPAADDVGPFYAYRGAQERIDGWRERVFSDITDAERLLDFRVKGRRTVAFAPPFGNYGQAGTNDPRIPRRLLARLRLTYAAVLTREPGPQARPGAPRSGPFGRLEVTPGFTDRDLHAALAR